MTEGMQDTPFKRGRRVSVDWSWYGWGGFGLGFFVDTEVMRTGEEGVERGSDIDVILGPLSLCCRIYRVAEYQGRETALDGLLRVEAIMQGMENWINQPALPDTASPSNTP